MKKFNKYSNLLNREIAQNRKNASSSKILKEISFENSFLFRIIHSQRSFSGRTIRINDDTLHHIYASAYN